MILDRGRIIGMWELGLSASAISLRTGFCETTVRKWIRRFQAEGNVETRPRSGRPRVTTQQQDDRILEAVQHRPLTSAVRVTQDLQLPCHPRTTRRRLHENNIHCYIPAKKGRLTQEHKEARLGFALQHLAMDPRYWNNVIFTDEKTFTSVEAGTRQCWRARNTRFQSSHIQERAVSGRVTVSLWGWMWVNGPGELVMTDGALTGRKYIEILEDVLLPTVRAMALPEPYPITLVHDRSSVHMSNIVARWLSQHPEIVVVDWPSKGCDLNPIENLWAIMCREWEVGEARNHQAVVNKAHEVWEFLRRRPNICLNLVNSMTSRLNEVVDAHGGWTSY